MFKLKHLNFQIIKHETNISVFTTFNYVMFDKIFFASLNKTLLNLLKMLKMKTVSAKSICTSLGRASLRLRYKPKE